MRENFRGWFHGMIIASLSFLLFSGCGYKAAPYWEEIVKVEEK